MVQDHRRRRDRDKNGRDFGVIDEAMRAVQRWKKRLPVFHLIDCGTRPALLKFRNPFTLNDINDFFVQMLFRFRHRPGRYSADVNSGDSLQTAELKIGSVTAEPAPGS